MPAKSPKAAPVAISGLPLELLLRHLPEAMVAEAMKLAIARLDMDAEKLALILVRAMNPEEVIGQGEEAKVRGVRHETLKKYKDEKVLPQLVNGK